MSNIGHRAANVMDGHWTTGVLHKEIGFNQDHEFVQDLYCSIGALRRAARTPIEYLKFMSFFADYLREANPRSRVLNATSVSSTVITWNDFYAGTEEQAVAAMRKAADAYEQTKTPVRFRRWLDNKLTGAPAPRNDLPIIRLAADVRLEREMEALTTYTVELEPMVLDLSWTDRSLERV